MNLAAQDTAHHLKAHPLPAISLIYGSEALLNAEALDALRARATADGFSERQRLYGDTRIDTLIAELETPSLFAPRRLLELYLDQKKADKATADTLTRLADLPLDNTRLIIYAPNLEKPHTTAWYKALFSKGNLAIASQALYPEQFAKQIRARLNAAKLRLTEAAYELLLSNCQGNLFAAKQAIERLTIHPQAHNIIDETLLTELLDDFSQFNTFALSDAILGADWLNAWRIAARLEAENPRDTTLVTWLIQRDMSVLIGLANLNPGERSAHYQQYNIFAGQQRRYQAALGKHSRAAQRTLLKLAARLDRITKGAEHGDYWHTLKQHLILRAQQQRQLT